MTNSLAAARIARVVDILRSRPQPYSTHFGECLLTTLVSIDADGVTILKRRSSCEVVGEQGDYHRLTWKQIEGDADPLQFIVGDKKA